MFNFVFLQIDKKNTAMKTIKYYDILASFLP